MARLSDELQLIVVAHALKSEPPASKQALRTRLKLVCKAWNEVIVSWKEVEVIELSQIKGLADRLEDEDEGPERKASVRSVYFELLHGKGKDKVTSVTKLLGLVGRLSRVEFRLGHEVFGGQEEGDTFSKKVKKVLLGWDRVKHFTFGGRVGHKPPMISLACIKELADKWSALRSVTLAECEITNLGKNGPLSSLAHLDSLYLLNLSADSNQLSALLANLPTSLRHLRITHPDLYTDPAVIAHLTRRILPIASNLRSLAPTDPVPRGGELGLLPTPRGAYARLVGALARADRLELGPCAVADLLPKSEVIALLNEARYLLVLEMEGERLRRHWKPAERLAVGNTAVRRFVRYVKEDQPRWEPAIVAGGRGLGWSSAKG